MAARLVEKRVHQFLEALEVACAVLTRHRGDRPIRVPFEQTDERLRAADVRCQKHDEMI